MCGKKAPSADYYYSQIKPGEHLLPSVRVKKASSMSKPSYGQYRTGQARRNLLGIYETDAGKA